MSSFTARFNDVALPRLVDQFAERDADGNFATLKYVDPRIGLTAPPLAWRGIPSRKQFQTVVDPMGGLVLRETKTWRIERELMDLDNVLDCQADATVTDDDGDWQVNEAETVWGPSFVVLGLMREPQTNGNECRVDAAL